MLAAGILGTTYFAIRRWRRGKVSDIETTPRSAEEDQTNTSDNVAEVNPPPRVFATVDERPRGYVHTSTFVPMSRGDNGFPPQMTHWPPEDIPAETVHYGPRDV
jgi:hypothetical protein